LDPDPLVIGTDPPDPDPHQNVTDPNTGKKFPLIFVSIV
jgi:hypothetical protein